MRTGRDRNHTCVCAFPYVNAEQQPRAPVDSARLRARGAGSERNPACVSAVRSVLSDYFIRVTSCVILKFQDAKITFYVPGSALCNYAEVAGNATITHK